MIKKMKMYISEAAKSCLVSFIVLIFGLIMIGCGAKAKDPVAQKVIDDINGLGEITIDDEPAIVRIEEIYDTLTDEQKNQVNNYIDLINARETVNELKDDMKTQEDAPTETILFKRAYYDQIFKEIKDIQNRMKNPDSYKVKEVHVKTNWGDQTKIADVVVYYSGTNSFGGIDSEYYSSLNGSDLSQIQMVIDNCNGLCNWDGYNNVQKLEGVWSVSAPDKEAYFFTVDVDDMRSQGYDIP